MKLKRQFEKVVLENKGQRIVLVSLELKRDVNQTSSVTSGATSNMRPLSNG